MLRVHFTAEDLARTRVAGEADPMWEIVGSLHHLQPHGHRSVVFDSWRRAAVGQLSDPRLRTAARTLSAIAPCDTYFPDFLTPFASGGAVENSIDTVLSTPRRRLAGELDRMAARRKLPPWLGRIAAGEPQALAALGTAFETYHRHAVAPHLAQIETTLAADRSIRAKALLAGGAEGLLASLGPTLRWKPPVLEADYPMDLTVHLGGRGMLLVPSYFCWRMPVALADPELPPVLVYPVEHDLSGRVRRGGLIALIGRTRVQVLETIGFGATTTEVARRTGIAPATASHHLTVLRDAGLVVGRRDANRVVYLLSTLGENLLDNPGE